jgi:hypothetical protein
MVHIIPVGRNQAHSLSAQYFSCTDQFGRICNSTGVHEKLSAGSEVSKGRGRLEAVVVDRRVILICMHVLMAKGMEYLTGVSWLIIGFSGDFW